MKRWLAGSLLVVLAGVILAGVLIVINVINSNSDPVAVLKKFGARIQRNEQGEVAEVDFVYGKITNPGRVQEFMVARGLDKLLLKSLGYDITKITDADLVHLKGFAKLQTLRLNANENITDAGLVHLKGLTGLQELCVSSTKVTDAGLVHLNGLTQLQDLGLQQTKVTDAGVAELKKALPDCKIVK